MAKDSVDVLVEGGKATAAPPLGPALGPMGVNIGQVVAEINKKTADFKGMQVPVKVTIDKETKAFSVTVGTPPASQLILKEAGIQKGSGAPNKEKVSDIMIEQVIKISKMKEDALLGKNTKQKIKEIIGTCMSMGVLVEGKDPKVVLKEIDEGKYDKEIASGKTDISEEERKKLEAEKAIMKAELDKKHAQIEALVKKVLEENAGKDRAILKAKMKEVGLPDDVIAKSLPAEKGKDGGKGGAKGGKK